MDYETMTEKEYNEECQRAPVERTVGPWRNDRPPNETWVQVMDGEKIIEAMAFYGREGYRPHWRLRYEAQCHPSRFSRWREIQSA